MPAFLRLALDENPRTLNGVFLNARSIGVPAPLTDYPMDNTELYRNKALRVECATADFYEIPENWYG